MQPDMGWPGTHGDFGVPGGHGEAPLPPLHPKSKRAHGTWSRGPRTSHCHLLSVLDSPGPPVGRAKAFRVMRWSRRLWLVRRNFTWGWKSQNKTRSQRTLTWSQWFLQFLITGGMCKGSFRSRHPPQRHQNIYIWSPQIDFYNLWDYIKTHHPH